MLHAGLFVLAQGQRLQPEQVIFRNEGKGATILEILGRAFQETAAMAHLFEARGTRRELLLMVRWIGRPKRIGCRVVNQSRCWENKVTRKKENRVVSIRKSARDKTGVAERKGG